jgi:PPE-repeat protein
VPCSFFSTWADTVVWRTAQAARLQQEAAAAIAAASAEDPPGHVFPGRWRAMHLDIAEAYTCPIVSMSPLH